MKERDRARETLKHLAFFDIPKLHEGVERGRCQHNRLVWISGTRARGTPLDRVDLLGVCTQLVQGLVLLHTPNPCGKIVRARGEHGTRRIPLDGVDFVCVPGEFLDRLLLPHLVHTHALSL